MFYFYSLGIPFRKSKPPDARSRKSYPLGACAVPAPTRCRDSGEERAVCRSRPQGPVVGQPLPRSYHVGPGCPRSSGFGSKGEGGRERPLTAEVLDRCRPFPGRPRNAGGLVGGSRGPRAGRPPLLPNVELELHFPFVGVVGVVGRHVVGQDLAHDEDLRVSGDIEQLRGDQRVAVVGLEPAREDGRGQREKRRDRVRSGGREVAPACSACTGHVRRRTVPTEGRGEPVRARGITPGMSSSTNYIW